MKLLKIRGEREERILMYKVIGALVAAAFLAVLVLGDRGLQLAQVIVLPALTGILGMGFASTKKSDP